MKKLGLFMFTLLVVGGTSFSFVSASGCGHDHIEVGNRAATISRGANVRDIACMLGSKKIATLRAGTKVRVVGKTAWTQIVMPDGRVGWVGNNFLTYTNDRSGVPAAVNNAAIGNYCDTTNPSRCMNPAALHVTPTFNYNGGSSNYVPSTPTYTPPTPPAYTPPTPTPLTDSLKSSMDVMVVKFIDRLENEYPNLDDQVTHLEALVAGLNILKGKFFKMQLMIEYLADQFDEKLGKLEQLLDI